MDHKYELDSNGQMVNNYACNISTELSVLNRNQSQTKSESEAVEEPLRPDLVPPPTLPDNFPDAQSENVFKILWQKVWNIQRYRDYRYGHSMSQKAKKDRNKWPFQSEEAFWRACASIPPRHRRKEPYPGRTKALGRNEAIAAYINDALSLVPNPNGPKKPWPESDNTPDELQELTRKNISSHLQVLRPWFSDADQFVYSWISGDHGEQSPKRAASSSTSRNQRQHSSQPSIYSGILPTPRAESFVSSRKQSVEPSTNFPVLLSQLDSGVAYSIDRFKLCMFFQQCYQRYSASHVCGPSVPNCEFEHLHTFTKTTAGGRMPDTEVSEADLYRRFPILNSTSPNQHQDIRFVFAEASLALPSHSYSLDGSVDLGIDARFGTKYLLNPASLWYCRTTFYESGISRTTQEQRLEKINESSEGNAFGHHLPFASRYWVGKLSELIHQLRRANTLENQYRAQSLKLENGVIGNQKKLSQQLKTVKDLYDAVSKGITRLSAKQEILEYPITQYNDYSSAPITHVIICWKFRQTQPGEEGMTQFRNLKIKPSGESIIVSRQESPSDTFSYQSYQQQVNLGGAGAPYSYSSDNYGNNVFPPEATTDGNFNSSYDFQGASQYQTFPDERPCSSLSNVKTVASTNSSISTGLEDFPEYQDGLLGRPNPENNILSVVTPPTMLVSDNLKSHYDPFNGVGNPVFGDLQLPSLSQSPNNFESLDKAFTSIGYQKGGLSQLLPPYNPPRNPPDLPPQILKSEQNYFTKQAQEDKSAYYDRYEGLHSVGTRYDSQNTSGPTQPMDLDDQFLPTQSFAFDRA